VIRIEHPQATLPDGTVQNSAERFVYDALDRIVEHRSAEGHRSLFDYVTGGLDDGRLARIVAGAGAENETVDFTYDAFGNVVSATTSSGASTDYQWDAIARLHAVRLPAVNGAMWIELGQAITDAGGAVGTPSVGWSRD